VAISDFQLFEKNAFEVFEVSNHRLRFIFKITYMIMWSFGAAIDAL